MFLPYSKCSCCGKRIGLREWWQIIKILSKKSADLAEEKNISLFAAKEIILTNYFKKNH